MRTRHRILGDHTDSDDECDSDTGSAYRHGCARLLRQARVGMDPDDEGKNRRGLDEICKTGTNLVIELSRGSIRSVTSMSR